MRPFVFLLLLVPLLSADPLNCTLHGVTASPELGARVDGETLRVVWAGERDTQLRADFAIDHGTPMVRELAAGEAILARNLTPEFTTVSGMRRAAHRAEYAPRRGRFSVPPLTLPGRGENPGLPRKAEEVRLSSSSFDTRSREGWQDGARFA